MLIIALVLVLVKCALRINYLPPPPMSIPPQGRRFPPTPGGTVAK